ncbi:APC family permease [Saccharothrix variisporea]|uniref:Amino acid/polyamine/organocation transporter (APC superfamily) n=1 Tax=Saccharothrix variisporea TaxID=543527 RepID=A0A495XAL8_9PSEU|nr:APC family permease [Saccharothrix variisporea]RKT69884.1 amino acid/polyamine/organocation transporter (APC superfamily) [Saccharothrix variisporea]
MTVTPRAGAVVLALGATLGVGVLTGLAPAAALAGPWFLVALPLAALTALCCAFSTADQHRAYPDAPGGYAYIRNQLGPWPARIGAGAHLIGRAGVAAALAGTFGAYVFPTDRGLAGLALLLGTAVLSRHVRGRVGWVVAAVVVGVLALVTLVGFSVAPPENVAAPVDGAGFDGIMGAASLLFIAFTGFERVTAPHPDEKTYTAKTLHVVIPVLIGGVLVLTALVGVAVLRQLGSARLALSPAPLRDALVAADGEALLPVLAIGVAVAAVASLSFVLGSTRRTLVGLTETGDLPKVRAPWALDAVGTALAVAAFLFLPPTTALAVGACGTAFYYGFTNAGARVLLHEDRTWPMRTACLGLGMSVLLAMSAPAEALVITAVGIAVGTGLLALGRLRQPVG